jgi:stage II sporulation protein E
MRADPKYAEEQEGADMKTRSGVVGLGPIDRLRQFASGYSAAVNGLLTGITGFILASAAVYQGISPFGVAWAGSVGPENMLTAALGAALGYVVNPDPAMNMKYIAALALMCGLRWLLDAVPKAARWKGSGPLYASFALLVVNTAITISGGFLIYDAVISLSEVALTAGGAYFFAQSRHVLSARGQPVKRREAVSAVISFGVLVLALAPLRITGLSLGRVLAVLVILLAARYGGEGAGAVAGIVAGVAAGASGGVALTGAYAVGGMVAGCSPPQAAWRRGCFHPGRRHQQSHQSADPQLYQPCLRPLRRPWPSWRYPPLF